MRTNGKASIYQLESTITGSVLRTKEEKNFAGVAVTDSTTLYISHFNQSIIPPPMCNYQIPIPNTILKACYSSSYLTLLSPISIILLSTTNYQNAITLTDRSLTDTLTQFTATQFLFLEYPSVCYAIIITPSKEPKQDQIFIVTIIEQSIKEVKRLNIKKVINVCSNAKYTASNKEFVQGINSTYFPLVASQVPLDEKYVLIQCEDKVISTLALDTLELFDFDTSPQLFQQMLIVNLSGYETIIGLTEGRKLYINGVLFAEDVTSVLVANDLLFFTKSTPGTSHLLYTYDLLSSLPVPLANAVVLPNLESKNYHVRAIERSAKIVSYKTPKLIMQLPRGNLETIVPRIPVLYVIRDHLKAKEYTKAFLECRRQRINTNLICDYVFEEFMKDSKIFIEQLSKVLLV
jgi:hypothetical protein